MPGYSGTPLVRKLGITDAHTVFLDGLPDGVDLGDLAAAHVVRRLPRAADVTLTFHTERRALARRLPEVFARTATDGMVWVCWPKKAAQRSARNPQGVVSDLDENLVRDLGLELGFVDVKVAAVDEVWSGLKFVRRVVDRRAEPAWGAGSGGRSADGAPAAGRSHGCRRRRGRGVGEDAWVAMVSEVMVSEVRGSGTTAGACPVGPRVRRVLGDPESAQQPADEHQPDEQAGDGAERGEDQEEPGLRLAAARGGAEVDRGVDEVAPGDHGQRHPGRGCEQR